MFSLPRSPNARLSRPHCNQEGFRPRSIVNNFAHCGSLIRTSKLGGGAIKVIAPVAVVMAGAAAASVQSIGGQPYPRSSARASAQLALGLWRPGHPRPRLIGCPRGGTKLQEGPALEFQQCSLPFYRLINPLSRVHFTSFYSNGPMILCAKFRRKPQRLRRGAGWACSQLEWRRRKKGFTGSLDYAK